MRPVQDATAHYRNRRFYRLRVKLYSQSRCQRKRAKGKKRDKKTVVKQQRVLSSGIEDSRIFSELYRG